MCKPYFSKVMPYSYRPTNQSPHLTPHTRSDIIFPVIYVPQETYPLNQRDDVCVCWSLCIHKLLYVYMFISDLVFA